MHFLPNRFQQAHLSEEETSIALAVHPLFYAYLQNKIAAYAESLFDLRATSGQSAEDALREHEVRKAQVLVLEELFQELTVPSGEAPTPPGRNDQFKLPD